MALASRVVPSTQVAHKAVLLVALAAACRLALVGLPLASVEVSEKWKLRSSDRASFVAPVSGHNRYRMYRLPRMVCCSLGSVTCLPAQVVRQWVVHIVVFVDMLVVVPIVVESGA